LAQHLEALIKGIELAGLPGLKQARQPHSGLGPLRTARPTADLAYHYQGPYAALGQVVGGTQPFDQHKLEQLVFVPQQALDQCAARVLVGFGILYASAYRAVTSATYCASRSSRVA
jgi:hypothetical protein